MNPNALLFSVQGGGTEIIISNKKKKKKKKKKKRKTGHIRADVFMSEFSVRIRELHVFLLKKKKKKDPQLQPQGFMYKLYRHVTMFGLQRELLIQL
jgi:hypothetical protein